MRPLEPLGRLQQLPDLVEYFKRVGPDAVLAAEAVYNLMAVWAKRVARLRTRVVVSEHVQLSRHSVFQGPWSHRQVLPLLRRAYRNADAIVAVSDGVADDLAAHARLVRERITTIYNPVVSPALLAKAKERLDHPRFAHGRPPVILAAGRLDAQKDFSTLIKAFAGVRAKRPACLMILGQGNGPENTDEQRAALTTLATRLGVAADVELPGFVANPFPYMARASVFVLSSIYEGLGNVLIEALACGCPVVSTDCPSGPAEILDHGRFGALVPVGDAAALARAIEDTLDHPPLGESLRARAELFTVERAVDKYLGLLFPGGQKLSGRAAA
jgi:glycosyltransferase involved in cell wall biosynthesis